MPPDAVMFWLYEAPTDPFGSVDGDSVRIAPVIVKIPDALVANCPSGLLTVTVRLPVAAPLSTVKLRVILVGLVYVTLFTVTPPPSTAAAMRFGKAEPGSKKPEPELDVPVIVTLNVAALAADGGDALEGVAGGGALS